MANYKPIPTLSDVQIARFWSRVNKTDSCWVWLGKKTKTGYGHIGFGATAQYRVHRVSWTLAHGPIPVGLHLDHLCRNRLCVNPAHLEIVTNKVNALRGESFSATNAAKTHCKHGHPLSADNLAIGKGSGGVDRRICRACKRTAAKRSYQCRKK